MRIIAGKHRGRKLIDLKIDGVRPTLDRVRENLFNILFHKVNECNFLDLFAGSGAIGIEAISRGAKSVTFSDKNPKVVAHIQKNVQSLGETAKYVVGDYASSLKKLYPHTFDVIYLDPPYEFDPNDVLNNVVEANVIDDETVVVYEHDATNFVKAPKGLEIYDERKYGIAVLTFLRRKNV